MRKYSKEDFFLFQVTLNWKQDIQETMDKVEDKLNISPARTQ